MEKALSEYSSIRKPSTDAICQLSRMNWTELSANVASARFLFKQKVYHLLHFLFPNTFLPLYTMVAFTPSISYKDALDKHKNRESTIQLVFNILILFIALLLLLMVFKLSK